MTCVAVMNVLSTALKVSFFCNNQFFVETTIYHLTPKRKGQGKKESDLCDFQGVTGEEVKVNSFYKM